MATTVTNASTACSVSQGLAAVSFDDAPGSRPSSIFLTVIATEAYQDLWARSAFSGFG